MRVAIVSHVSPALVVCHHQDDVGMFLGGISLSQRRKRVTGEHHEQLETFHGIRPSAEAGKESGLRYFTRLNCGSIGWRASLSGIPEEEAGFVGLTELVLA